MANAGFVSSTAVNPKGYWFSGYGFVNFQVLSSASSAGARCAAVFEGPSSLRFSLVESL